MDRRDSKTPAGDMWHVLNVNRRVEAAEAAIMGMTNLIDTITAEIDDLKSASYQPVSDQQKHEDTPPTAISKQEQEIVKKMASKVKSLHSKVHEIEKSIDDFATKDQLQSFCTIAQVKGMIQDKLDTFQPMFDISDKPDIPEPTVPQVKKDSSTVLKKKDSRESTTRIAYQEVSGKMVVLEQEISKAKERMHQLEQELSKKLELVSIEGKADKTTVSK